VKRAGVGIIVAVAGLGLLLGSPVRAATADGTLITNVASASYRNTGGVYTPISYGATVTVIVATPSVMLRKVASPTLQASGGTVTFCISYSNSGGLASAFDVTITDAMPDNMKFAVGAGNWDTGTSDGLGTVTGTWSTNGTTWGAGLPPNAQGGPVLLRWTIDVLSPKASGYACYTVSVM
jgi:uncharacterized repeat protein (TIGR01451 family)